MSKSVLTNEISRKLKTILSKNKVCDTLGIDIDDALNKFANLLLLLDNSNLDSDLHSFFTKDYKIHNVINVEFIILVLSLSLAKPNQQ